MAIQYAWRSWQIATLAIGALITTIVFVLHERRAVEPVIPMRLFVDRTTATIFVMGFLLMFSLVAVSTFLPLFLQVATGASATKSGLMLTPQSVTISAVSGLGGWLVSRTGRYKWALLCGPVIAVVALLLLTRIGPDTGALDMAPALLVFGAGLGLIFPNLTLSVQNASPIRDLGIATSTSNFFRSMGGAFGAAAAGSLLSTRLDRELLDRLGEDRLAQVGGAEGLIRSPKVVEALPTDLRVPVIESVSEAVVAIIWRAAPIMALLFVLALFVQRDTPSHLQCHRRRRRPVTKVPGTVEVPTRKQRSRRGTSREGGLPWVAVAVAGWLG